MAVEMTCIREFAVLVPLAVVAVVILVVRTSVLTASLLGIAAAVLMSLWVGFEWQIANVRDMGLDSLLLTASVAMVIVPGLGFNALVRSHGLTRRLARWVRQLPVTREGHDLARSAGVGPGGGVAYRVRGVDVPDDSHSLSAVCGPHRPARAAFDEHHALGHPGAGDVRRRDAGRLCATGTRRTHQFHQRPGLSIPRGRIGMVRL